MHPAKKVLLFFASPLLPWLQAFVGWHPVFVSFPFFQLDLNYFSRSQFSSLLLFFLRTLIACLCPAFLVQGQENGSLSLAYQKVWTLPSVINCNTTMKLYSQTLFSKLNLTQHSKALGQIPLYVLPKTPALCEVIDGLCTQFVSKIAPQSLTSFLRF